MNIPDIRLSSIILGMYPAVTDLDYLAGLLDMYKPPDIHNPVVCMSFNIRPDGKCCIRHLPDIRPNEIPPYFFFFCYKSQYNKYFNNKYIFNNKIFR